MYEIVHHAVHLTWLKLLLSNVKQAGTEKSLVDVLSFERVSVRGVANMP